MGFPNRAGTEPEAEAAEGGPAWVSCGRSCVATATARARAVRACRVLHVARRMRRAGKAERRLSALG